MLPNNVIAVTDHAGVLLQRNPPLYRWISDCFAMSAVKNQVWTSAWVESLQSALKQADSQTVAAGYQLLTEDYNNQLQQPYKSDENTCNEGVCALLLKLLVLQVYLQTIAACHPYYCCVKLQSKAWEELATQLIKEVPQAIYLKQLSLFVLEGVAKKPIPSSVDRALLAIHRHALNFSFQQLLQSLRHTTQAVTPVNAEESVYQSYMHVISMSQVYSIQLSTLKLIEPEHLAHQLFKQLTQLIEQTSTLDLSPSWMDRLKQWIVACFSKLQLLYKTMPDAAENTASALLYISRQLCKSAKKAVRKEKLQSPQLLRERCWQYFTLYEQLTTQYWNQEKQPPLQYHATALTLFNSFMSTFEWPCYIRPGILKANPLKLERSKIKKKQAIPVALKEHLLEIALNKLRNDFFVYDWIYSDGHRNPEESSFMHWLVLRQKSRLLAKIDMYVSNEAEEFKVEEIDHIDKRQIYLYVHETYKDFCADINQITQMVLSVWFSEVGIILSHAEIAHILSTPGRWLASNPVLPKTSEDRVCRFSYTMWKAVAKLGAGTYFFPGLQQRWSIYEKALAAHAGELTEFVEQHQQIMRDVLNKLFLIFHPDHHSEVKKKSVAIKSWSRELLPDIKGVKNALRKNINNTGNAVDGISQIKEARVELDSIFKILEAFAQSESTCPKVKAILFLNKFERIVQKSMFFYLESERIRFNLCLLPEEELKGHGEEVYACITQLKQRYPRVISARQRIKQSLKDAEKYRKETEEIRKETEAIRKETEAIRKEKEAALARAEAECKEKEAERKEKKAIRKETEAIRKETEAIRKEKEAIRKETEAIRKETETIRKETETIRKDKEAVLARVEELEKKLKAAEQASVESPIASTKQSEQPELIELKTMRKVRGAESVRENTAPSKIKTHNVHTLFQVKEEPAALPAERLPLQKTIRRSQSCLSLFKLRAAAQEPPTDTVCANTVTPKRS